MSIIIKNPDIFGREPVFSGTRVPFHDCSYRLHRGNQVTMPTEIGIKKAKDQLSRLLFRVAVGEEITITRKGVPIARLIAVDPKPGARKLGIYGDKIWIADDFDAPLPPDVLAGFLGGDPPKRKRKKR